MFRKSVRFFILIGLLWLALWLYLPDSTPNQLSFSDFLRGLPLLFSVMAFGLVLLMLIVRYKGVDIATNFIPHAGIVMWLGKHAYEFSQPKVILSLKYIGQFKSIEIHIHTQQQNHKRTLLKNKVETIKLGLIDSNPTLSTKQIDEPQVIDIIDQIKKVGKNYNVYIELNDETLKYHPIK